MKTLDDSAKMVMIEMGNIISSVVSEIIRTNSIDLEPLTQGYAKEKGGGNILVLTSQYVNHIEIFKIEPRANGIYINISVPPIPTANGVTLRDIAMFHEYGTEKMVARRPIGKAWESIEGKMKREIEGKIRSLIEGAIS